MNGRRSDPVRRSRTNCNPRLNTRSRPGGPERPVAPAEHGWWPVVCLSLRAPRKSPRWPGGTGGSAVSWPQRGVRPFARLAVTPALRRPTQRAHKCLKRLADPTRFERATFAFGGRRSIQLSYGSSAIPIQPNAPRRKTAARIYFCSASHAAAAASAPEGSGAAGSRSQPMISPIGACRSRSRSSR